MQGGSWQGWKDTNQTPDLSSSLPGKAGTQTTGRVGSRVPGHPAWLWGRRPHSQGISVATLCLFRVTVTHCGAYTLSGPHPRVATPPGPSAVLGVQDTPRPGPDVPLSRLPIGLCPLWEDENRATSI